ncbi:MAG: methyltransferase domain-containing protein [Myxococcales bacterium]|nr:methyltransferase domain-containing protein [Myxococcales bacterium]
MDPVLVCPACRTRTAERIDLRTLEPVAPGGELLACACGRRYPVVDGVPIVCADPAGFLRDPVVLERDLAPEVAAVLVEGGPDDAVYPRLLEVMSVYLDAHWGDRATPPPDGIVGAGAGPLFERLAARRAAPVARAVELGASVGRGLAELARGAEHVVGVDLSFGALRRARHLLAGELVRYPRRVVGRRYAPAAIAAGELTVDPGRVTLVCADALDPPLVPGWFDRVVALNVIDNVAHPGQLLAVMDGLCAPGGELVLSSPYTWQSGVTAEDERLGGDDPAAHVREVLETGRGLRARYRVEDEAELPWTLRRERRSSVSYRVHYLRARKLAEAPGLAQGR